MDAPDGLIAMSEEGTFKFPFKYHLADYVGSCLYETQLHSPRQPAITPNNSILLGALLCASSTKNALFTSSSAYDFVRQGLQLPGEQLAPANDEIVATGACLQLSIAGGTMMKTYLEEKDGIEAVVQALKALKDRRVIKVLGGRRLLDKTIAIAEGNFSQEIPSVESWDTLFSSESVKTVAIAEEKISQEIPPVTAGTLYSLLNQRSALLIEAMNTTGKDSITTTIDAIKQLIARPQELVGEASLPVKDRFLD